MEEIDDLPELDLELDKQVTTDAVISVSQTKAQTDAVISLSQNKLVLAPKKLETNDEKVVWDLIVVVGESNGLESWSMRTDGALLNGLFRRVYIQGYPACDPTKTGNVQKWTNERLECVADEKCNSERCGWSLSVLRHLQKMSKVKTDKGVKMMFVHVGESLKGIHDMVMSKENEVSPFQQWVKTDLVPSSPTISFSDYYQVMCWRPPPPSERILTLTGQMAVVSMKRTQTLPQSFYERAILVHSNLSVKISDLFFNHTFHTFFSNRSPPIHE